MPDVRKARVVGFNHVAIEVGDIEEALAFYGRLFDFELRSKSDAMAFIDLGDQFLAQVLLLGFECRLELVKAGLAGLGVGGPPALVEGPAGR
ncbi:MAG: VOC family protein, partial [Rhodospirillales bacterium]|nr:VOC family protein [Rhodospirillales bacterium]